MNEKVIDSSNDLGIVISGGTQNSSLNIQGTELNNNIGRCIASGLVDMMGYFNTSSATLFIQGIKNNNNNNNDDDEHSDSFATHRFCTLKDVLWPSRRYC